jgi:hypothetical protein
MAVAQTQRWTSRPHSQPAALTWVKPVKYIVARQSTFGPGSTLEAATTCNHLSLPEMNCSRFYALPMVLLKFANLGLFAADQVAQM